MSSQLTPQMTVPAQVMRGTAGDVPEVAARRVLCGMRRAVIRLRAGHVTRAMFREMLAGPQVSAVGHPQFVRLDALQERYAAVGGDPDDLVR